MIEENYKNIEAMIKAYNFIEQNLDNIQYHGFYLLEKFNELKTGNVNAKYVTHDDFSQLKLKANTLKDFDIQLAAKTTGSDEKILRGDAFYKHGIDTPYFMILNKGNNISVEDLIAQDETLYQEINHLQNYLKNKLYKNHDIKFRSIF